MVYTRALEPVATDFLDTLAHALQSEKVLDGLNDHRALNQVATDIALIRGQLGAGKATRGTRLDYFHWLIERNFYLDPRGIFQTRRQVQVKLDDIYISLRAQRDATPTEVDRRLLERELEELETMMAQTGLRAEEGEGPAGWSGPLAVGDDAEPVR